MNSLTKLIKQSLKTPSWNPILFSQVKFSSYRTSPLITDLEPSIKFEVTKDPAEWAFVERLLPLRTVPVPVVKAQYHSEWKPQVADALKQPYFVKRSRNHMIPVYLLTTYRGMRRLTRIRNVEGDIWQMDKDIKAFLKPMSTKPIRTQVHEYAGFILVHGDHVNAIKHWLQEKHF